MTFWMVHFLPFLPQKLQIIPSSKENVYFLQRQLLFIYNFRTFTRFRQVHGLDLLNSKLLDIAKSYFNQTGKLFGFLE